MAASDHVEDHFQRIEKKTEMPGHVGQFELEDVRKDSSERMICLI